MGLGGTLRLTQNEVERIRPTRVVFDSLSQLRLLAPSRVAGLDVLLGGDQLRDAKTTTGYS